MEVAEMQPDEYLQGHHICTLATATKAGTPRAVESGGKQQGTFFAVNFREDLVHQVFRGVTPGQAQEIATQLTPRELKEGEVLFHQGSRRESFFIVVSGGGGGYQEEESR